MVAAVWFASRITPLRVQRQVSDGRKVVQFGIGIARLGQLDLRLPQLLVLHLQLDLVDLQFVDEFLDVGGRYHGGGIGTGVQERFGALSEVRGQ